MYKSRNYPTPDLRGVAPVPTEESIRVETECPGGCRGAILQADQAGTGSAGSWAVNQRVPEFETGVVWGARPHSSRTGGPMVNTGPPLHFSGMFPGVIELARLNGRVSLFWESGVGPASVRPRPFRISYSPGRTESGDDRSGRRRAVRESDGHFMGSFPGFKSRPRPLCR